MRIYGLCKTTVGSVFIKIECIDRDKHYHINAKVLGIRWSVIQLLFCFLGNCHVGRISLCFPE